MGVCGTLVRNRGGNLTRLWTFSHPPASPFTSMCLRCMSTHQWVHLPAAGRVRAQWQPRASVCSISLGSAGGLPSFITHTGTTRSDAMMLNPRHGQRTGDRQDLCLCTRPPALDSQGMWVSYEALFFPKGQLLRTATAKYTSDSAGLFPERVNRHL